MINRSGSINFKKNTGNKMKRQMRQHDRRNNSTISNVKGQIRSSNWGLRLSKSYANQVPNALRTCSKKVSGRRVSLRMRLLA